jgi:hypothetical protein
MGKRRSAVAVFLTGAAAFLLTSPAGAVSPQIERNIPNTKCGINAYEPGISNPVVTGDGLMDCNGNTYNLQIEACIQESNNGSSGWTNVSCKTNPASGTTRASSIGSFPTASEKTSIYYRTWAWGNASGNTATVTSDPEYSH